MVRNVRYMMTAVAVAASAFVYAAGVDGAYVHPKCKAMLPQKKMMTPQMKAARSPFLITHGLPHLTKKLKMMWDDKVLNLTDAQKEKLLHIRQETIGAIKALKPQIMRLQKEIVMKSKAGESAEALASKVQELAKLKAEATMTHLKCLEKTKAVLTKDQLFYLMSTGMKKHAKAMKPHVPVKMMKCASGKCGNAK